MTKTFEIESPIEEIIQPIMIKTAPVDPSAAKIFTTQGPQAGLKSVNLGSTNVPQYPSVQGQIVPDLNLAGTSTPKTDLSGGNFADSTPPQNLSVPPLKGSNESVNQMGISPTVYYFDLNLANNNNNIPSPAMLAQGPQAAGINDPTFGLQDYSVRPLKSFDLQEPGIDAIGPFDPDPHVSDLLQFDQPGGIDITAASSNPMAIDPAAPDLSLYDRPAGLLMPGPLMVDPLHPDLQNPTTTQQVHMPERPGDLDMRAMSILHSDPTCQDVPYNSYEGLWMAQAGTNNRRERHLGMLGYGLEREEAGA